MQKYKTVLVLGCGRSGRAAEALLRSEGTATLSLDESTSDFSSFKAQVASFLPEAAVVSPGFALTHPWIKELAERGIPMISELELGWSRRHCPVIAVTGSNGKSTVVKWIAEALAQAGQKAVPCGNYGFPVCAAVMLPEVPDWLVIEVSSFQLETVQEFRPDIGLLLNVLPNHLDRHGSMDAYRDIKLRLFENMTGKDTAILPIDLFPSIGKPTPACGHPSDGGDSIRVYSRPLPLTSFVAVASRQPLPSAVAVEFKTFGVEQGADFRYLDGRVGEINLNGTRFANEILGAAGAAVAAVCAACGIPPSAVEASARVFEPLPHRTALVAEIDGVKYVDDSKATNIAAMCAAVKMCSGKVHLIAGGRVKERDFSLAKDLLAQRVSHLYLIGEASGMMQAAWGDAVRCMSCGTLEKAVEAAQKQAMLGDTVLLSPACTSFDQFRDFNERGDCFAAAVRGLGGKDKGV